MPLLGPNPSWAKAGGHVSPCKEGFMQRTPLPASPYHIIDDIEHTELLFGRHLVVSK